MLMIFADGADNFLKGGHTLTTYQSVFSKVTVPDPEKLRNAVLSGKRAVPWYRRKTTYGGIAAALACIAVAVLVGHVAFPDAALSANTTAAGGGHTPADFHITFTLDCTLSDERRIVPAYAELPTDPMQKAQLLLDKFGMNLDADDYTEAIDAEQFVYDDGVYWLYVGRGGAYKLFDLETEYSDSTPGSAGEKDNNSGKLVETTVAASHSEQYTPLSEAEYLEMAAAQFDAWNITLPEGLEMTYYETEIGGIITWDADNLYDEHACIRGGIRIVYYGDKLDMLEYTLAEIPSCGTQEIISEQEAYARLPEEAFIWWSMEDGVTLAINSCVLEYSYITSNDPEPVYVFHTLYQGIDHELMVPAKP